MRSQRKKTRPAAIGMLAGIGIGGAIGALAFAFTQDPLWFILPGLGVAFGLAIGAGVERRQAASSDRR